jgi:phosphatidylinositol alpha-mannosyltransferase
VRVGLICPYSLTLPGGVQGQVLGLGRALQALGVPVRILGPCDGPPPDPSVTPLGNSIPTASNGSLAAIAPDPSAALRTIRALRDENFDVVHLHEPFAPGPTLTAMVLGRGPLVGTFHRSGDSNWIRALRPLVMWGVSHLTIRVAVSEEARITAMGQMGGSYELLWNGIDIDQYQSGASWPTTGPTIMFLGRHEPRKGLSVLIEAMSLLGPDVRLWIASQGPETERLRSATASDPRIEWLGPIDEEEKISRIRGCDVLCAPSLHGESFGVVLLEGLAAGTPVVASDLGGYRNVVTPGVNARLTPPGDWEALAKALQAALENGPETVEMVANGLERIRDFSMDSLASRYVEIYERAADLFARARVGG